MNVTRENMNCIEAAGRFETKDIGSLHKLKVLFFATLYLSSFTLGGGYVIISLLKNKFVDELKWIDEEEMMDFTAIAQAAPGPIAVNGAIIIGYKICGFAGILCAVVGAVIPPFAILTCISFFYSIFRSNAYVEPVLCGMRSGVSAVIISAVWDMGSGIIKSRDFFSMAVMIITFILDYYLNINVVIIILGTLLVGIIKYLIKGREGK